MKHALEILSTDVSGFGPFNSNTVFRFNPKINIVVGDHGTGKSALAAAISAELNRKLNALEDPILLAESLPIMVVNESTQLPYPGRPWNQGLEMLSAVLKTGVAQSQFIERFHSILRVIIQAKLAGPSKFSGIVSCSRDISIRYSAGICIDIFHTETGDDLNWAFQASGERAVMFIALICALRELLNDRGPLPLVWDDFGGMLDRSLLSSCFDAIKKQEGQIILLMQRNVADTLGERADIELSWGEGPPHCTHLKLWQATHTLISSEES